MPVVVHTPVVPERFEYYLHGWKTEVEFPLADDLLQELYVVDINWAITGGQYCANVWRPASWR
jgi:hypothetical protein